VVVVSAMGKTTNALEKVVNAYIEKNGNAGELLATVKDYHHKIMQDLFTVPDHPVFDEVNNILWKLTGCLKKILRKVMHLLMTRLFLPVNLFLHESSVHT